METLGRQDSREQRCRESHTSVFRTSISIGIGIGIGIGISIGIGSTISINY